MYPPKEGPAFNNNNNNNNNRIFSITIHKQSKCVIGQFMYGRTVVRHLFNKHIRKKGRSSTLERA